MKVIAVEVAARLAMQTCKAATESRATTGEVASTKAAHAGAAAEPAARMTAAHMTAAAEPAAHMTAATEAAPVSTSTSPAAARKRVGGESPGESGSCQQHDHGLT
jgi:hypothetical protein